MADSDTPVPSQLREPLSQALADRFRASWRELAVPGDWRRLLVAVSGGPDSLALMHLMADARPSHRLELVVAHADHGIHPDSEAVAAMVQTFAEGLGLPTVTGRLRLGPGTSETAARRARYEWLALARQREGADAIVLAHHQDDQIETVLMRALAGSGPAGLAGMAPRSGRRLRPLLSFRKAELVAWVEARGLTGWADPANVDQAHARSWLRQVMIPLLESRSPDAGASLLRLARQAAEERRAWDAALHTVPGLDLQVSTARISVAALPLATYDSALASALLQAAARRLGCVLGGRRAARVLDLVRGGKSGGQLELGGAWRAELAFGRVCFFQDAPAPAPFPIEGPRGRASWGAWRVSWNRAPAPETTQRDGWVGWFIGDEVVLRAPAPGDRLYPLGGSGRRAVARLLQEARVERSRRAAWPLVEVEGSPVWVAGICRAAGAVPAAGSDAIRIEVSGG